MKTEAISVTKRFQVLAEIGRILESGSFGKTGSSARLLQYLVEGALKDEGADFKEYVLGKEVFDRGEGFDPRLDPIVRVQARRLRQKLAEFYKDNGTPGGLRIDIPKGSYAPVFVEVVEELEAEEEEKFVSPVVQSRRRMPWWAGVVLLGGGALLGYGVAVRNAPSPAAGIGMTALTVQSPVDMSNTPATRAEAGVFGQMVVRRLGPNANFMLFAQPHPKGYTLRGFVKEQEGQMRLVVELVRNASGEVRFSGTYDRALSDKAASEDTLARMVSELEATLAGEKN